MTHALGKYAGRRPVVGPRSTTPCTGLIGVARSVFSTSSIDRLEVEAILKTLWAHSPASLRAALLSDERTADLLRRLAILEPRSC